jgi:VWFA-related protein
MRRPITRLGAVLLLAAASPLGAQAPAASAAPSPSPTGPRQGPPPVTFAVEVGYVEVDAIVTDRNDQPVRDLTREDFTVLEDGKPQTIDLFSRVDIPYERPEPLAPTPVPLDVKTNAAPFEGRVYVIVLDELHTSTHGALLVRAAARRFIERHFGEGDLAAVVHTFGAAENGQGLTSDRKMLLAAVDRFTGQKLPSVTMSRIDEYRRTQQTRQPGDRVNDPDDMKRAYDARTSLDVLKGVAEWLSRLHGRRKAVLFFSEGIDYNTYDQINNREASAVLDAIKDATAAAVRANVSFYTIDPRGLGGLSGEMMEIQPVFDDPALGLNPQGLDSDLRISQDSLRVLAEETSGFAAVNTNDFSSAFARVVKDNSAYYVLGYYPPGQRRDGRFHKLEVKVSRPGVKVRARSGYSTPRTKPPKPPSLAVQDTPAVLAEMLDSPLPQSGLPMQMQAGAFRGAAARDKARVVLTVELSGDGFKFTEKGGLFHDVLDLTVLSVDPAGKPTGKNQKIALDLKPRTHQLVTATGFRVLSETEVPPGRWQFRVAGRSQNSGNTGSVFYDLDVPDFDKQDLALSGLVLTSSTAGLVPTAGAAPLVKEVLPGPPTAARTFYPFDTLALFMEIYDREKTAHTLDVATTLTASDGQVAYRVNDERNTASTAAASAGKGFTIVHTAQVPLKDIPPGIYTLRVAVTSRLGKKPPKAERALLIQVIPAPPDSSAPVAPSPRPSPPA